jgi:hypothetical protein
VGVSFVRRVSDEVAIVVLRLLEVGKLLGVRVGIEVRNASAGYGGCL